MAEKKTEMRKVQYSADVLAHIAAHKAKGDTKAVAAHMANPGHKAIVEAAKAAAAKPKTETAAAPTGSDKDKEGADADGQ